MPNDVYTAGMGQPPMEDDMGSIEALRGKKPMMPMRKPMAPAAGMAKAAAAGGIGAGAANMAKMAAARKAMAGRPNPADAGVFTADKGMPPSPDEGPTMPRRPMPAMKKGGCVKKMKSGGSVCSASKRADGIATKGKTKGKFV